MESRVHEINIFNKTDSSAIGLKLAGSSALPFLWTKIVQAFLHLCGTTPDFQMAHKVLIITVQREGHRLEDMIEI